METIASIALGEILKNIPEPFSVFRGSYENCLKLLQFHEMIHITIFRSNILAITASKSYKSANPTPWTNNLLGIVTTTYRLSV